MSRIVLFLSFALSHACFAADYDPQMVPQVEIASNRIDLKDASRDRTLPLRVYLPPEKAAAPVILFSHGLGGSCDNNPYLGNHWAKRGYAAIAMDLADEPDPRKCVMIDDLSRTTRAALEVGMASILYGTDEPTTEASGVFTDWNHLPILLGDE